MGALLVADEESGHARPHIAIEARVVAEAHATLWVVGFRLVQGLVQRSRRIYIPQVHNARWVATCLATREAFHSGLWVLRPAESAPSGQR